MRGACTPRAVITAYVVIGVLFTLSASIIWAVNTLFLMSVGLTIFEVMLVNTAFVIGQIIFEIPTGVVADTIGRKASLLISFAVLVIATVMYVAAPLLGWGIPGFAVASVLIGLGFCFQTGAMDAWLVDALDACGWEGSKDRVFAWGAQAFGVGMLVGTLIGGALGQVDLSWPYYVRAVLLVGAFVAGALLLNDHGFEPRPLKLSTFGAETNRIFRSGLTYGWHHPVVRPLLYISALGGAFFLFGWYSWQRYMLDLLGREYVWLAGVVTAGTALAGIAGNTLVKRVMRTGELRRDPSRVLGVAAGVGALLTAGIGAVGLLSMEPGWLPFWIATVLWLAWSLVSGVSGPVRQAYINDQIPSSQRATVLSLDAFFTDVGGAAGQPALGWVAERFSIPVGWVLGSVALGVTAPLYRRAGRAAREMGGGETRDL